MEGVSILALIVHTAAAGVVAFVHLTPLDIEVTGQALSFGDRAIIAHLWPLVSQCSQLLGGLVCAGGVHGGVDRSIERLDLLQLLLLLDRSVVACRDGTEEDAVARHATRGLRLMGRSILTLLQLLLALALIVEGEPLLRAMAIILRDRRKVQLILHTVLDFQTFNAALAHGLSHLVPDVFAGLRARVGPCTLGNVFAPLSLKINGVVFKFLRNNLLLLVTSLHHTGAPGSTRAARPLLVFLLLLPVHRRLLAIESNLLVRGRLVVEDVVARVVLNFHDSVVVRQGPHSGVSAHLAVNLLTIVVIALAAAGEHVLSRRIRSRVDRALVWHTLHVAERSAGRQPTTQLPGLLLGAVILVELICCQSGRVILGASHVKTLGYQLIAGLIGAATRVDRFADWLRIIVAVKSSVETLSDESFRIILVPDASLREWRPAVTNDGLARLLISGICTHAILRVERLLALPG